MTEDTTPVTLTTENFIGEDPGFVLPKMMKLPKELQSRINRALQKQTMLTKRVAKRRAKNKMARRSQQINRA